MDVKFTKEQWDDLKGQLNKLYHGSGNFVEGFTVAHNPPRPVRAYVNFILDESGSMMSQKSAVISGFNEYVDGLRKEDAQFLLTRFNGEIKLELPRRPTALIHSLSDANYQPNGNTALYDAIGKTVQEQARLDGSEPYKVIVIIMTDGEENASREFRKDSITALIKEKEKLGNWTFVYLGATQDAWNIGMQLGMSGGNVVHMDMLNVRGTFDAIGKSTVNYMRSTQLNTAAFCASNVDDYVAAGGSVAVDLTKQGGSK